MRAASCWPTLGGAGDEESGGSAGSAAPFWEAVAAVVGGGGGSGGGGAGCMGRSLEGPPPPKCDVRTRTVSPLTRMSAACCSPCILHLHK